MLKLYFLCILVISTQTIFAEKRYSDFDNSQRTIIESYPYNVDVNIDCDSLKVTMDVSNDRNAEYVSKLNFESEDSYDDGYDFNNFLPAAMPHLFSNMFEKSLYYTMQLILEQGDSSVIGQYEFLERLNNRVFDVGSPSTKSYMYVVQQLNVKPDSSEFVKKPKRSLKTDLEDLHKPHNVPQLPFEFCGDSILKHFEKSYFENPTLQNRSPYVTAIHKRDRFLQKPIVDSTVYIELAKIIREDAELKKSYERLLKTWQALYNGFRTDYISLDKVKNVALNQRVAYLPPIWSFETGKDTSNVKDVYSMSEMVRGVRNKKLPIEPTSDFGLYGYKTYCSAPLLIYKEMPEGEQVIISKDTEEYFEKFFIGLKALERQRASVASPSSITGGADVMSIKKFSISIMPNITIEPHVSSYFRHGQSYEVLKNKLIEIYGDEYLKNQFMKMYNKNSYVSLFYGLEYMTNLYEGLGLISAYETGVPISEVYKDDSVDKQINVASMWRENIGQYKEIFDDVRAMVPVEYNTDLKEYTVWIIWGFMKRGVSFDLEGNSKAVVKNGLGEPIEKLTRKDESLHLRRKDFVEPYSRYKLFYKGKYDYVYQPFASEEKVKKLLSKVEFRALCDSLNNKSDIIKSLNNQPVEKSSGNRHFLEQ